MPFEGGHLDLRKNKLMYRNATSVHNSVKAFSMVHPLRSLVHVQRSLTLVPCTSKLQQLLTCSAL